MKHVSIVFLVAFFCLKPIPVISEDNRSDILVFDLRGGQTPRINDEPLLLIKSDHTLILGAPYGKRKRIQTRIDDKRLQDLLHFILNQQHFLLLETKRIQQIIDNKIANQQSKGKLTMRLKIATQLADAPTSYFSVTTGGKVHNKSYYALGKTAKRHPEIVSLQQLYAIQKRLMHEMNLVVIGGEKSVKEYLNLLNEKLSIEHPEVSPLGPNNLEMAFVRADGTLWMQWRKTWQTANGRKKGLDGYVTAEENQPTKIKLNVW